MAVFSDDGVDVQIDDNPMLTLNNFGKPHHLPTLAQSFHVLKGPEAGDKWKAGKIYHVKITYSNIIFLGNADIDGCTFFAYNGGGSAGEALICTDINRDEIIDIRDEGIDKTKIGTIVIRDADEVYKEGPDKFDSAKRREIKVDTRGIKKVKVIVRRGTTSAKPKLKFDLKLFKNETGGDDLFVEKGKEMEEIKLDPGTYWLQGGPEASEHVRDQFLTARLDAEKSPCTDQINVTVLWVDLTGRNSGDMSTDKNGVYDGFEAVKKLVDLKAMTLKLGVQRSAQDRPNGAMTVRGRAEFDGDIKPPDLLKYLPKVFDSVKFVDGKGADMNGNLGTPATADFGFIFRRFVDQKLYANGLSKEKESEKKQKLSFSVKGFDDSDRLFQDIHPDDPNPKNPENKLLIVDVDAPSNVVKQVRVPSGGFSPLSIFFASNRINFKEHVVFNFLKKTPERCSIRIKWAFSSDIALGGPRLGDFSNNDKAVFIFGLPNDDNTEMKNTINEVLIEGQGGINTGELPSLKLELKEPVVKKIEGKKDFKVDAFTIITVEGENLIGEFLLRSKNNPKMFIFATIVRVEPSREAAQHFSPLKSADVFFFPKNLLGGEFEFVIKNEAGESKPVGGFKIIK